MIACFSRKGSVGIFPSEQTSARMLAREPGRWLVRDDAHDHYLGNHFFSFCYYLWMWAYHVSYEVFCIHEHPEIFGTRVGCHVSAVEWV